MPLKRHPALIPLSHAHRDALFAANLIRTGGPVYPGYPVEVNGKRDFLVSYLRTKWQAHVQLEENLLFPFLGTLRPAFREMQNRLVEEHRELEVLLDHLLAASQAQTEAHLNEISQLMVRHVRYEERTVFEWIQDHLPEDQLEELGKRIRDWPKE
ncbi:MAG: hemerythrin domain-containing protein [Bacteroidota bacterium]